MTKATITKHSRPTDHCRFGFRASVLLRKSRGLGWGFTLVELLVVIAVIALLAALLLPALKNARKSAKRAACVSQIRQIHIGLMLYTDDYAGGMPSLQYTSARLNYLGTAAQPSGLGLVYAGGYLGSGYRVLYDPAYQTAWSYGDPKRFLQIWTNGGGYTVASYAYRPPITVWSQLPQLVNADKPELRAVLACSQPALPLNSASQPLVDPASLPYVPPNPGAIAYTCFSHDWEGSNFALIDGSTRWVQPRTGYSPWNDQFIQTAAGSGSVSNHIWNAVSRDEL